MEDTEDQTMNLLEVLIKSVTSASTIRNWKRKANETQSKQKKENNKYPSRKPWTEMENKETIEKHQ